MQRRFFRAGEELSILGFPGLMLAGLDRSSAGRLVGEACEAGINYFDSAPVYGDGEAERMLGKVIAPYRAGVLLASKTLQRNAAGARKELEESLRSLRTERLDLYQFHALSEPEEVERLLAPGGAAESLVRAREEGKIRFIGCSAHTARAALLMLDRCPLDSIVFPINFVCYSRGDFGAAVLQRARELGVARLAVKAMALTRRGRRRDTYPNCWYQPVEDPVLADQALRFTLSEDVTSVLPPADAVLFRLAVELSSTFEHLDPAARRELLEKGRGLRPFMPLR